MRPIASRVVTVLGQKIAVLAVVQAFLYGSNAWIILLWDLKFGLLGALGFGNSLPPKQIWQYAAKSLEKRSAESIRVAPSKLRPLRGSWNPEESRHTVPEQVYK